MLAKCASFTFVTDADQVARRIPLAVVRGQISLGQLFSLGRSR